MALGRSLRERSVLLVMSRLAFAHGGNESRGVVEEGLEGGFLFQRPKEKEEKHTGYKKAPRESKDEPN